MALTYNKNVMGKLIIAQGTNEYEIEIRQGNCLAVFIYPYQDEGVWYHQLYSFFSDEQHIKNYLKGRGQKEMFPDVVKSVRLNLKYKECSKLLKHLTMNGYEVTCYYE